MALLEVRAGVRTTNLMSNLPAQFHWAVYTAHAKLGHGVEP